MWHKHLSGPKDVTSLIRDVRFNLYPKGSIASEKQRGIQRACVRARVCMSVQSNKRLINTYSSHWFPVAA